MITRLANLVSPALAISRTSKRLVVLLLDIFICLLSAWFAFYLRLGTYVSISEPVIWAGLVSVGLLLPIFIKVGIYRAIFRYNGMSAMITVMQAIFCYCFLYASLFTFWGVEGVPRTLGLIQPILLFLLVGASRLAARVWLGGLHYHQSKKAKSTTVIIYGAGSAGRKFASAMMNSNEMRVVAFLDDDVQLHGNMINGIPIHDPKTLAEVLFEQPVTTVLIALPSVSRQRRIKILESLSAHKIAVRTLPGLSEIATGKVKLSDVRELDIHDLLGRDPVIPDEMLININTHNKVVLVTGAGGSIGSELCRQILMTQPKRLLLVEISEFALYQVHQDLLAMQRNLFNDLKADIEIFPLLASVCDEVRMQEIMQTWTPHTVYHAAAYKHVPLVEHNPAEGVRNNVWGTLVCAEVALRTGVKNFVLISTDKAVRPTNIMGASKRLAEMVLQGMAELDPDMEVENGVIGHSNHLPRTIFSTVRFGNVLGSSGSVVPLFREQIKNGGPITLTHTEITRYFMTIPEAAQLVIQAGAMGTGGDVFVLDMGQPVKIIDLARRMVELSGLTVCDMARPDGDIVITVTGLRPGEKLYEELLIGDNPVSTQHDRIMKANEQLLPWAQLGEKLNDLSIALRANDVPKIRGMLQQIVSGYQPNGEVVDWVHMTRSKNIICAAK